MGSIVEAKCSCGYAKRFFLGGGLDVHESLFVFLCRTCSKIVVLDMDGPDSKVCDLCNDGVVSYSAPGMSDLGSSNRRVFGWNAPSNPMTYDEAFELLFESNSHELDEEAIRRDLDQAKKQYDALDKASICELHSGSYECPACKTKSLRWEASGHWD